jgi:hypothetical protein
MNTELGMTWWNGLTERERREWMARAGNTGVAADAWAEFQKSSPSAGDVSETILAHEAAPPPPTSGPLPDLVACLRMASEPHKWPADYNPPHPWTGAKGLFSLAASEIERLRERERMLLESHTGCGCTSACQVCEEKGYT